MSCFQSCHHIRHCACCLRDSETRAASTRAIMDFDDVKSCFDSSLSRARKRRDNFLDILLRQLFGTRVRLVVTNSGRCPYAVWPTSHLFQCQRTYLYSRCHGARFTTRVRKPDDLRPCLGLGVVPYTNIIGRCATLGTAARASTIVSPGPRVKMPPTGTRVKCYMSFSLN